mmetsp:Transcript_23635/g.50441  ORF Transcript_23635/g.50441 Transcript_23635/m.50441 type:complete len:497 (+) Transcript_23635:60-1550(+)
MRNHGKLSDQTRPHGSSQLLETLEAAEEGFVESSSVVASALKRLRAIAGERRGGRRSVVDDKALRGTPASQAKHHSPCEDSLQHVQELIVALARLEQRSAGLRKACEDLRETRRTASAAWPCDFVEQRGGEGQCRQFKFPSARRALQQLDECWPREESPLLTTPGCRPAAVQAETHVDPGYLGGSRTRTSAIIRDNRTIVGEDDYVGVPADHGIVTNENQQSVGNRRHTRSAHRHLTSSLPPRDVSKSPTERLEVKQRGQQRQSRTSLADDAKFQESSPVPTEVVEAAVSRADFEDHYDALWPQRESRTRMTRLEAEILDLKHRMAARLQRALRRRRMWQRLRGVVREGRLRKSLPRIRRILQESAQRLREAALEKLVSNNVAVMNHAATKVASWWRSVLAQTRATRLRRAKALASTITRRHLRQIVLGWHRFVVRRQSWLLLRDHRQSSRRPPPAAAFWTLFPIEGKFAVARAQQSWSLTSRAIRAWIEVMADIG